MSRNVMGKFEIEVDIKSSGDTFHEILSSKPHHLAHMSPSKYHAPCELHKGEFGKPGSVILWHYTLDGKQRVAKEIVEAVDEEKKYVRFKVIEGDLLDIYKSFIISMHVVSKADEITAVKWILEFEKKADDVPYPTNLLDGFIEVTRDIEAYHLQQEAGRSQKNTI